MHRDRHIRLLMAAVAVVVVAMTMPWAGAKAADDATWSVEPGGQENGGGRSAFIYTLKPGQVFQDVVSVSNVSDVPLTFDLYATDAYNTKVDAAFALLDDGVPPVDAGSWVTLTTNQITVQPNTRADIPFQVAVPQEATPGDHIAGIIAAADIPSPQVDQTGATVQVRRRVATRMYVRVEGPVQADLQITQLQVDEQSALFPPLTGSGQADITYEIRNTGNIRLTPTADLVVTGWFGRTIHRFEPHEIPELLPGGSVLVTESFTGLPPLEHLTAELTVTATPEPGQPDLVVTGSASFWAVSWLFVLLLALIVLAVVLVVLRARRRRRGERVEPPEPSREPVGA
jgi:hypothetical protein